MSKPLVEAVNVIKHFPLEKKFLQKQAQVVHAVDGVDLAIQERETLALVGESGCGKSTLGRLLIRLLRPTAGEIRFDGVDLSGLDRHALRKQKKDMQIVFQDPYSSLNPRKKVLDIVSEPLETHTAMGTAEKKEKVAELLSIVGLQPSYMDRYPHMFSGGQRQRIGIARSIALDPRFVVCDEPVSALDVSIQSQIINLLQDLQDKKNLTYLFISHDLNVVRYISNRVCVMFLGKIVESGPTDDVYEHPLHPYTMFLVSAAPVPDPGTRYTEKRVLQGEIPSPVNPPAGCRFHTRCPFCAEVCRREDPPLTGDGAHMVACHFPLQ